MFPPSEGERWCLRRECVGERRVRQRVGSRVGKSCGRHKAKETFSDYDLDIGEQGAHARTPHILVSI